jgi:tight adherence protein C
MFLLAIIGPNVLVPLAAGGAAVAGMWLVLESMAGKKPRLDERLDEFRDPSLRRRKEAGPQGATEAIRGALEKATPALAKPLQPQNEKDVSKLKQKLAVAGFRSEGAATAYLGLKVIALTFGCIVGGGGLLYFGLGLQVVLRTAMFACGMFFLPDLLLYLIASKRKEGIFLGLPDALDLMVVCVEAGLGLDQAMRKVAEEMRKSYRVIAEEFGLCNLQLQMGRTRGEALQELGSRSGVEDLKQLASILIQADKFGSSIAQALRVQSQAMRTRRRQMAEEKAAKTAVKLIFPLVLFIFPGIFVVLVGPAGISMYREMFTAMNGGGG